MKSVIKLMTSTALGICVASIVSGEFVRVAVVSGMTALISVNLLVWYGKVGDKEE